MEFTCELLVNNHCIPKTVSFIYFYSGINLQNLYPEQKKLSHGDSHSLILVLVTTTIGLPATDRLGEPTYGRERQLLLKILKSYVKQLFHLEVLIPAL